MAFAGVSSDPFAAPDKDTGAAYLTTAENVNITAQGSLTPRPQAVSAPDVQAPPKVPFFNFGRRLSVDGGYLYASKLMDEDVPEELLYIYVGESPRLLWCTDAGTYVSVTGALLFLSGGQWPPELNTVLNDDVLSVNVALVEGAPSGYILCRGGVYQINAAGQAVRADNEKYRVPADIVSVVGVVVPDPVLAVDRVVFSELPYF